MTEPTALDEHEDKRTPQQIARHYFDQLELSEKDHKPFLDAGDKVIARYKSTKEKKRGGKRLNILYSNTEHLRAALFGKSAVPDVRRRFGMEDKPGQLGAEIVEKALVYCAETYDSDRPIELAIQDYLLPGRGVVRVEYEPVIGQDPQTGMEAITDQHLKEVYVYWKDFRCSPGRTWADVCKDGWVAFRHTMTRADMKAANFEDYADIPLNWQPEMADQREVADSLKKAEVWELWDITDRKRYWLVKGHPKPARIDDDPLGLEGFFPMPEPLSYYTTSDTVIPEPEFHVYSDQADDLDEITDRISKLTKALKRRGVYDASVKELARLSNAADNQFIPVENYTALATKGGLQAAFQNEDIKPIADVLLQLYTQRDSLIQAIWEICGIGDIQRGNSDPNETLGAQQLKAQFGSQRLMRRQRAVQRWVRDLLKLKAEIIAEHFEPQILMQMTGMQPQPQQPPQPGQPPQPDPLMQAFELLRSDKMRGYRIDIETDSTVFEDAEAEKKSRNEMLQGVTGFVQGWAPLVAEQPLLAPTFFEFMKHGIGGFKSTRALDDAIEQLAEQYKAQQAQAAQEPAKPSPEEQAIQAEQQKAQAELQVKQQELQMKAQGEQVKAQMDQQREEQKLQFEREKHEQQMQFEREKHANDMQMRQGEMAMKREEMDQQASLQRETLDMTDRHHSQTLEHQVEERETKDGLERDKIGLPANPTRKVNDTLSKAVEALAGASQAIAGSAEQSQQMMQVVAQSNQEVAAAITKLAAPRRRVPNRGPDGRVIDVHDMPMMQ